MTGKVNFAVLFGLLAVPALCQTGELLNADKASPATFLDECRRAASQGMTLIVSRPWTAKASGVCTADLRFVTGGIITPDNGVKVTLTGSLTAPMSRQIFSAAHGGSVTVSPRSAAELYTQWWGAVWDGSTDDTAAIQATITASKGTCIPIVLPAASTKVATLDISAASCGIVIRGAGSDNTVFTSAAAPAAPMMEANTRTGRPNYALSGFSLRCSGSTGGDGLYLHGAGTPKGHISDVDVRNCTRTGKAGMHLSNIEGMQIDASQVTENYDGILLDQIFNNNTINGLQMQHNLNAGWHNENAGGNVCNGCLFQSGRIGAIMNGGIQNTFVAPWFENNSAVGVMLNNEKSPQFVNGHYSYPSTPFMTINNSSYRSPGMFSGEWTGGQPVANLQTTFAGGNTWMGGVGPAATAFVGAGASPMREILPH